MVKIITATEAKMIEEVLEVCLDAAKEGEDAELAVQITQALEILHNLVSDTIENVLNEEVE